MDKIVKDFLKEIGYSENTIDEEYLKDVNTWLNWYKGKTDKHSYYTYNGKRKNKREIKSLYLVSQTCEDLSDFFFNEKLEITIDNKKVNTIISECLRKNKFLSSANKLMQLVKALGTGAIIPYLNNDELKLNYISAPNITILKTDNEEVIDVLFYSEEKVLDGTEIYLNAHLLTEEGYVIINKKYLKKNSGLYLEIDLEEAAYIETHSMLPKFVIIRTPSINNKNIDSPYGMSCYANALDVSLAVDKAYDSLINEIELGKKRVYVKTGATQFNVSVDGGVTPVFDPSDVAYYQVPGTDKDPLITESSFKLRIEELTSALQFQINIWTSKVDLGKEYYKYKDGQVYVNTQNVMSSNSDVYRKIKKQENIITEAIITLIYAIAELLGIRTKFNVSVNYDDSIIEDKENTRKQAQTEYNSKLISKAQYYRDVYKLDEESAIKFAEQMKQEIITETINDGTEFSAIE